MKVWELPHILSRICDWQGVLFGSLMVENDPTVGGPVPGADSPLSDNKCGIRRKGSKIPQGRF
jgi:hypothetical protein